MSNFNLQFVDGTSKVSNLHPLFFTKKKREDIEADINAMVADENRKPLHVEVIFPEGQEPYKKTWLENVPKVSTGLAALDKAKPLNAHGKEIKYLSLKPRAQKA